MSRNRVAGAVAVLLLTGCGAPSFAGAPATSPAPQRTSGALADGFEIEPGSGLIGAVFPLSDGNGWQAVLRVDRDAEEVFHGYVHQAQALGEQLVSEWSDLLEGQFCGAPGDDPPPPFRAGCAAYSDPARPHEVALTLRGYVQDDGGGYVHLRADRVPAEEVPLPPVVDGEIAPSTDVEVSPELTPETDDPPVRVVQGSVPAAEPIPAGCITGGYLAVLQVDGDAAPVMRGYEAQFADALFGSQGLGGDDHVLRILAETAGGGQLAAVAVVGKPSFVLLERCND